MSKRIPVKPSIGSSVRALCLCLLGLRPGAASAIFGDGFEGVAAPPGNGVFAPYVDMLLFPTFNLSATAQNVGTRFYTLAFIIAGNGCQAAWGGVIPLADETRFGADIAALRALSGDVIVSFGGAAGVELGVACASVDSLRAQYQAVIDKYQLTQVDFDIEGAIIAFPDSVRRRNQAIAALQADAQQAGRALKVSYTLPVLPTGLTADGVELLRDAIAQGVEIGVVNIMAMDYGGPAVADPFRMGDNAIAAANSTLAQLRTLYPGRNDAQLRAMLGITPMIGLNDVVPEVFTLADAQQVVDFAKQNRLGRLAFWSMARDQGCPGGAATVSATCSGIAQQPFDFARVFLTIGQ